MPSVDLTTLPGWASLSTGSHNITVVAKAAGYRDSEPSAAGVIGAFFVNGSFGDLDCGDIGEITCAARPAFQIDLSKIAWSK